MKKVRYTLVMGYTYDPKETSMLEDKLTIPEAAQMAGHTPSYILRMVKDGKITGERKGNFWLLDKASVAAFMATPRKRGGSKKGVAWSHHKAAKKTEANQQPAAPKAKAAPVIRVSHASEQLAEMQEAKPATPAPTETTIDTPEGAHITIDPLQPDRQRWMHAEAIKGDVTAWADIRPYPDPRWPGGWVVDYYFDRKDRNKKGAMGRNQEERAQALMHLLRDRLTEALHAQGWQTLTKTPSGQTLWHYRPGQKAEQS
jgi:excisionase family DNA binding protein